VASLYCISCKTTTVKKAGTICAGCIAKSQQATPEELADVTADAARPAQIVDRHLKQTAAIQERIQKVMDTPEMLLCAHCGENPRIVEQVSLDRISEYHVRYGKVIASTVPAFLKLKDGGKDEDSLTRDEMADVFCAWFDRQSELYQRDIQQRITRILNEKRVKVV
jgi:hypothetical protein